MAPEIFRCHHESPWRVSLLTCGRPVPPPVCSANLSAEASQEHVFIGIVYSPNQPFLHALNSCSCWSGTGIPVTANHHERYSYFQKENRTNKTYSDLVALTELRSTPVSLAAATVYKNTCRGHQKIWSFEILCNRVSNLSTVPNPLNLGSLEDNSVTFCRQQLQASLNANKRVRPLLAPG